MKKHEEAILAFVAGYVDTLGFVALFGLFTAHVTGNFVLIGAEIAGVGQGVLLKLLAFPAFIVGVASASVLTKVLEKRGVTDSANALHVWQAFLLLMFLAACWFARPIVDASAPMVLLSGVLGATAMGVQNARAKVLRASGLPNTVMTGNVTQVVLDIVELTHHGAQEGQGPQVLARLRTTLVAMSSFAIGAILGALAFVHVSFIGLALPIALLLALTFVS
ncbi:YoaK family protein [Caballeronia sp. BR00000012568055]|uniref:YoaK family protein n=1 Tax=Caballeronia sp. BR00000012568055 TaxID=2918761 RepID=UPI0023F7BB3D